MFYPARCNKATNNFDFYLENHALKYADIIYIRRTVNE